MRTALAVVMSVIQLLSFCSARQQKKAATPQHLPDMIDRIRGSVVQVAVVVDVKGPPPGLAPQFANCFRRGICVVGTGFFVSDSYDVATAAHVSADAIALIQQLLPLDDTASLAVFLNENNSEAEGEINVRDVRYGWPFRVRAEDRRHDVAILSPLTPVVVHTVIKSPGYNQVAPTVATLDPNLPRDGSDVFACGYPLAAEELTTTVGHVASAWEEENLVTAQKNGLKDVTEVYTLDLNINPGNSGGPAFNSKDQTVIGMIVETKNRPGWGGSISVAVRSRYLIDLLQQEGIPFHTSVPQKKSK